MSAEPEPRRAEEVMPLESYDSTLQDGGVAAPAGSGWQGSEPGGGGPGRHELRQGDGPDPASQPPPAAAPSTGPAGSPAPTRTTAPAVSTVLASGSCSTAQPAT